MDWARAPLADFAGSAEAAGAQHDDLIDALVHGLTYLRDRAGGQIDHDFQKRALERFRGQSEQRESDRSFDGVADEGSRLYGTAAANNAREERAELMARSSPRWRWHGF